MKHYLLSILLLLIPFTFVSAQQTGSISGTVFSSTGDVLPGANVVLDGTALGVASNLNGEFTLNNIAVGSYTLKVSYVGYQTLTRSVTVRAGETLSLRLTLNRSFEMPQIELIGSRPQRLDRVPGSAAVITAEQIAQIAPLSGMEVVRRIAGVHAYEIDPVGLRTSIGIRGLDPTMSRSVLILEDGIPVSLAPYGEPEMYYSPAMDRMSGVELVKGSGSILFGPQTFGGVLNFITADPPATPTTTAHFRGGEGGFFTGLIGYGTTVGNTGFNVTYLRKQGDEVGILNYNLNDLTSKIKLLVGERSSIGIKLGFYDETSNSTYVGLTQPMFETGNFDFTHLAPDDVLDIRRYSASVTHNFFINPNVTLRTTAFGYTTTRNWSRQDFDTVRNPNRDYIRILGNPDVPGGALFFRDQTGNRNRQFEVAGFEPRISINFNTGTVRNELDAGFRYLYERAFEQRVDGNMLSPQSGTLREDEIRTGHAVSVFMQNAFNLTESFSVTPGIRYEYFEYTRDIRRLANEQRDVKNTDETSTFIPGLGLNYRLRDGIVFYGGVHRGYGPPRVKDAISADGVSQELDAEKSWNFEAGTRATIVQGLDIEVTGFFMNFSNQIIPVSEAAGGTGAPGASLVNGGATEHRGIETSITFDTRPFLQSRFGAVLSTSATFMRAEFSEDRFVNNAGQSENVKGNRVPYAPDVLISSNIELYTPFNVGLSLTGTYVGNQFGDVLNREVPTLDGRQGPLDSYFILDGRVSYQIPALQYAVVSLSVKNLLDERYMITRRPQGIRLGMPRFISAGLDFRF